jgi:dihydrofolate reductase
MNTVIFDMSISLDGFLAAADRSPEEPLGVGGERLHGWAEDDRGRAVLDKSIDECGAVIVGRTTYDDSLRWWGADGPTGSKRLPTFVITHTAPAESPPDGVYRFVTGGVGEAVEQARAAAGDGTVSVAGGADLARQLLAEGLLDQLLLHVVPVLFGSGTRLLDGLTDRHIGLELLEVIDTRAAVHVRYGVIKETQ